MNITFFKNSRKRVALFVLLGLAVICASGCQSAAETPENELTPVLNETAATEINDVSISTPARTPTIIGAEITETAEAELERKNLALFENPNTVKKEILIWLPPQFDPANQGTAGIALGELFAQFMEEHPNVTISYRIKDTSGDASGLNMLSSAAAAAPNALPALMVLDRNDMVTAMQKGLIYPVKTELFADDSSSWFGFARESATVDNALYGVPIAGDPLVLAYRPALTGPDMNNWEEILTRGLPIGFEPNSSIDLFGMFIYLSQGGRTKDEQGKPMLDQEILTQTLNFFLNGGQKGAFPPAIAKDSATGQSWKQFTDGTYQIAITKFSQYHHSQRADFTVMPIPRTDENSPYPLINTWNVVITTQNDDLAALGTELAEMIASPEFNDRWTHLNGYLPVRTINLTEWEKDAKYAAIRIMSERGTLLPGSSVLTKLVPIVNGAVSKVILTTKSPELAASEALEALY